MWLVWFRIADFEGVYAGQCKDDARFLAFRKQAAQFRDRQFMERHVDDTRFPGISARLNLVHFIEILCKAPYWNQAERRRAIVFH